MLNNDAQALLKYFNALVFDPAMDSDIPVEFMTDNTFLQLDAALKTIRNSAAGLSRGNLCQEIPGSGFILDEIKALQASLKTLTEKTVAATDREFSKSNDVSALSEDFSNVFNTMAQKLESFIQEIKETQEHFEMVFYTIPDSTIITTLEEGEIITYNDAFLRNTGFTREELIALKGDINKMYYYPQQRIELLEKLKKDGIAENMEVAFRNKANQKLMGLTFSRLITIKGKVYILSVIKNINPLKEMEAEIRRLSVTDKLTQIFNRMKLDETLEKELKHAQISGVSLSLIMMDIDYFKAVNDTYGHQVGDAVLVKVAEIMKLNVRDEDVVGRWGGEEFLIILPGTDKHGGVVLAEKLRTLIAACVFPVAGNITASFGAVTYLGEQTPESFIGQADYALYRAKNKGRNRVES